MPHTHTHTHTHTRVHTHTHTYTHTHTHAPTHPAQCKTETRNTTPIIRSRPTLHLLVRRRPKKTSPGGRGSRVQDQSGAPGKGAQTFPRGEELGTLLFPRGYAKGGQRERLDLQGPGLMQGGDIQVVKDGPDEVLDCVCMCVHVCVCVCKCACVCLCM